MDAAVPKDRGTLWKTGDHAMTDTVRVESLRGIMMRGPGITATLPFYEDMWGLKLAHAEEGTALLRGTGEEAFLYGLKDGRLRDLDCSIGPGHFQTDHSHKEAVQ